MKYMEVMAPASSYVQNLIKKLSPPLGMLTTSNNLKTNNITLYNDFVILVPVSFLTFQNQPLTSVLTRLVACVLKALFW